MRDIFIYTQHLDLALFFSPWTSSFLRITFCEAVMRCSRLIILSIAALLISKRHCTCRQFPVEGPTWSGIGSYLGFYVNLYSLCLSRSLSTTSGFEPTAVQNSSHDKESVHFLFTHSGCKHAQTCIYFRQIFIIALKLCKWVGWKPSAKKQTRYCTSFKENPSIHYLLQAQSLIPAESCLPICVPDIQSTGDSWKTLMAIFTASISFGSQKLVTTLLDLSLSLSLSLSLC